MVMTREPQADPLQGRPVPVRSGLTGPDAARRLGHDGRNLVPPPQRTLPFLLLASSFTHSFALLLWAAAALAFIGGLPEAAWAVVTVIVVSGLVGFVLDYWSDRIGQRLRRRAPAAVRVIRDGRQARVNADELVVNDVVLLRAGDRVPADIRLTEVHDFVVVEVGVTGMREMLRCDEGTTVFAGTHVAAGEAEGVVVTTGMWTRLGQDSPLLRHARRPSGPLVENLRDLTAAAAAAATGTALVVFLLTLLVGVPPAEGFLPAVGLAVALVPLGLRSIVHLCLAWAAQRMADAHALVRHSAAVQQLGTVTFLCVPAAGVLTRGEPVAVEVWTPEGTVQVTGTGYAPEGALVGDAAAVAAAHDLALSAALCSSDGYFFTDGQWRPVGDPVEAACHVLAARAGVDVSLAAVERRYPFDPHRRRASAFAKGSVHVKGAPDAVLPRCRAVAGAADASAAMADRGLRVLAVARRDLAAPPEQAEDAERDLTLLGLIGLADPPRSDARTAVTRCRRLGIRLALVTGEDPRTALAVARATGLARPGAPVLHGAELPDDLREIGELLDSDGAVVSRVTPEDRRRVTVALQHRGYTVATTAGGAADDAALRRADVGIAPGYAGADTARDSADLVLLDSGIATVAAALGAGRAIRVTLRRALTYRLTGVVAMAAPFLVWAVTGGAVPPALTLGQVLAIGVGVDLLPALALGVGPRGWRALRDPPPDGEFLVDRRLAVRVGGVLGPVEAVTALFTFGVVLWVNGWQWGQSPAPLLLAQASGAAFATIVLGQVAAALACRSETRPFDAVPWRSDPLPRGLGAQLLLLWLFFTAPPLAGWLGSTVPPGFVWPGMVCVVPALLAADTIHKVVRPSQAPG